MSRKIGENHNIFTDTAVNLPPPKGGFAVGGNYERLQWLDKQKHLVN